MRRRGLQRRRVILLTVNGNEATSMKVSNVHDSRVNQSSTGQIMIVKLKKQQPASAGSYTLFNY